MGRLFPAGWISGGFSGGGLLSSSSKYFTHRLSWPSFVLMVLLSLSFSGRSGLVYLPDSFLVVSCIRLMFPFLAAASAWFASLLM